MKTLGEHPVAALFPMLDERELAELAEDIKANGQQRPIITNKGLIVDGRNRWRACQMVKVKPKLEEREFADEGAIVNFILSENLRRRHLSASQRAMLAVELEAYFAQRDERCRRKLVNAGTRARDQAAQVLGVGGRTVGSAKVVINSGSPDLQAMVRQDTVSVRAAAEIARLSPADQAELVAAGAAAIVTRAAELRGRTHRDPAYSSESNEHYTPSVYIEAAREVLGEIDLDPASCEEANRVVRAKRIYTREDDGLKKPWYGRIWLNMPFGLDEETNVSNQARWSSELAESYDSGEIKAAIMHCNAYTAEKWFLPLWSRTINFPDHRIKFNKPGGLTGVQPRFGSAFVYFGPNPLEFRRVFRRFGRVVLPDLD